VRWDSDGPCCRVLLNEILALFLRTILKIGYSGINKICGVKLGFELCLLEVESNIMQHEAI